MSISFCPICKVSKNVAECCGRSTFMDEAFESLPRDVPMNALAAKWEAYWDALRAMPVEESHWEKLDRLEQQIESLGWDAFRLEKAGELERAANLRTEQKAAEAEFKRIIRERDAVRFPKLTGVKI